MAFLMKGKLIMIYKIYINSNGWKELTKPTNDLRKVIATLDYTLSSGREIMVKRTTDRDEIIFNSMFDDYETFRENARLQTLSCVELKEEILDLSEKKGR